MYRPNDESHVPSGDGSWEFSSEKAPITPKEEDRHAKLVFGRDNENMHNTHNGEIPGHHTEGAHPEPQGLMQTKSDAMSFNYSAKEPEYVQAPTSKYFLQSDAKVSDFIDVMTSPDDLSML